MKNVLRLVHAPPRVYAVTVGFGLAYLAALAGFALAFEPPSARGWGGYAIVVVTVLAITVGAAYFMTRSDRIR